MTGFVIEYEAEEKHTVTYDANGGVNTPNEQVVLDGVKLSVSEITPELQNAEFLGWSTKKNAKEADYHSGEKITIYGASDETDETSYVATKIEETLRDRQQEV